MKPRPRYDLAARCGAFPFLRALAERVLVCDGAMGTMLQRAHLVPEDFLGLDGCNEILCDSRPDVVAAVHRAYFEAGADLVETNTFGSTPLVLAEYGLADRAYELSKKAAELARKEADALSTPSWPRFVSGAVGPTTKLVSLQHISYDDLFASFVTQIRGLIDGGSDVIQIETAQDLLGVKCAVLAARRAMEISGRELPIITQVTIETTGTMLVGTEIAAALPALEALDVDVIGLNCATGPDLMHEHVRYLGESSARFVSVLPNAGLPRNVGGVATYDLLPEMLAEFHERFVKDYGVSLVGGCCGTTPAHIAAVRKRLAGEGGRLPQTRSRPGTSRFAGQASSLYLANSLSQDPPPLIIGERSNANGSKKFRELLLREDFEGLVEIGREQVAEGAHLVDVCVAYVGRDEVRDMREVLRRYSTQITLPLCIDSTQLDVLEVALKHLGGRAVINSVNLEDGEERADRICALAREYGAALIALTIDEEGMAKTGERKVAVARRLYDIAVGRWGLAPSALLFDPLTFTIASGDEDSRDAAIQTLNGIRGIKEALPGVGTLLGVSNVSFGLKPYARQVLNSVFLSEAILHGLDAAIVSPAKILPLSKLSPEEVDLARDLVYDRRQPGYDPLFKFIERFTKEAGEGAGAASDAAAGASLPIEERLQQRIIDGKKIGIDKLLEEALNSGYKPLEIINGVLLKGMKTVGDLFGSGQMQLPFVLQSAETMKAAVAYLEPFMEKLEGNEKGVIVLATVKGDVHDIGKNLVDIILSNNGYRVVNLGIKQPADTILEAAEKNKADAIGLSGLLVKSTVVMKENLELMSSRGISIPVLCGGAALTRGYVEGALTEAYRTGEVYYGLDAFTGLKLMDELCGHVPKDQRLLTGPGRKRLAGRSARDQIGRRAEGQNGNGGGNGGAPSAASPVGSALGPAMTRAEKEEAALQLAYTYAPSDVQPAEHIPAPPFWGAQVLAGADLNLREIFGYINRRVLFRGQWQYRRGRRSEEEYRHFITETVEPKFYRWCERAIERRHLKPKALYGYFPCYSHENDLVVLYPPGHPRAFEEAERFTFPRQPQGRRLCISDFFRKKELAEATGTGAAGQYDVLGVSLVTMGETPSQVGAELFQKARYDDYLHFHGLAVEATEALAELIHRRMRHELGIAHADAPLIEQLFSQGYQGSRYSFGYPACPNLEDHAQLFRLIQADRIGIALSEEFQLVPEQSTCAIIAHHPDARYFSITSV
ncbi:MAG: methionine synthase [Polyangia bacterium]